MGLLGVCLVSLVSLTPLPWNDWLACHPALTLALAGTC